MDNNLKPNKLKEFFSLPKIIFLSLGIIVIIELIYAVRTLSLSAPSQPSASPIVKSTTAKISLNAAKTTFRVNEVVPVTVAIDTGGRSIDGVDLIVQFDPETLEITKAGLEKGDIIDEYPLMSVDVDSGLVSISGISNLGGSFAGKGEFATLNFKAKQAGSTSLTVNFEKDTTTASNLIEINTSKNILEEVDNLEITIE